MIQVAAIFLDSYRELNSKKLFWITLVISGMVVLVYASIGFNEEGMSMFFGLTNIESPIIKKGSPWATMLYRSIFSTFIVGLWLAWIATILAIISTTTIFPDFVAGGAVDMVLSKPISRIRVFVVKYLASLLFVLLQVSLFCLGIFICMGWRIGEWNWLIFAAIPLITLFFSYLYCVNVLVGITTRSALTALLVTMLFWFSLFGINTAEAMVTQFRTGFEVQAEKSDAEATRLREGLAKVADDEPVTPAQNRLQKQIDDLEADSDEQRDAIAKLDKWRTPIRAFQVVLPKTSETIGLLDRWLRRDSDANLLDLMSGNVSVDSDGNFVTEDTNTETEVGRRLQAEYDSRSHWYLLGSSIGFELVVLGLACFVFVRRDY